MTTHHVTQAPTAAQLSLPAGHWLGKLPLVSGLIGIVGVVLTFVLGAGHKEHMHFAFHTSYIYFLSIALGGLFFVLVQFATRAGWSVVVRRFAESMMATLPLFAILFIPMLLGMHTLYHHWTDLEAVKADPFLSQKQPYLNETFFFIRAGIYFVLWAFLAWYFYSRSTKQDVTGDQSLTYSMQKMSYPGIAIFALTSTFAAFDWIMSLDPHWYSTMFGVYYFAGCVVAIYAALIVVSVALRGIKGVHDVISTEHLHDLGKLLFAHTVFWAYIAFSQYFLIWYANIPEETLFFYHRFQGTWLYVSVFLAVGHFAVPFFFLMPRTIKRKPGLVLVGALWMLLVHFVDIYWLVMPTHMHHGPEFNLIDIAAIVGVGGLFIAGFSWFLGRRALVPVKDPRLPESLAFENL